MPKQNKRARPYGLSLNEGLVKISSSHNLHKSKKQKIVPYIENLSQNSCQISHERSDQISEYLNLSKSPQKYNFKQKYSSKQIDTQKPEVKQNDIKKILHSISDSEMWKCQCGKIYRSYCALYLHRKNKHSQQNPQIIKPYHSRKRGRPKKIDVDQQWEMRIYHATTMLNLDCTQWQILTIIANEHSNSNVEIRNGLNQGLCQFLQEIQHPFGRACVWILKYHLNIFFDAQQNQLYRQICSDDCKNLPLLLNIIANWWNQNNKQCLFILIVLNKLLQIFLQWLYKHQMTAYLVKIQ